MLRRFLVPAVAGLLFVSLTVIPLPGLATEEGTTLLCGDVNDDGWGPDMADIVTLISHLFRDPTISVNYDLADVDGDGGVNIGDIIVLVQYVYENGPPLNCIE
ncbi:MAG TPA: hypothetical protein VMY05_07115 [Acidobacteriota bacterium]|nr:hypothetical protein [Acidobacteriota bacterium]